MGRGRSSIRTIIHVENPPCGQWSMGAIVHVDNCLAGHLSMTDFVISNLLLWPLQCRMLIHQHGNLVFTVYVIYFISNGQA
jgi:hypothetical protein